MAKSTFPAVVAALAALNSHGDRIGRTHIHKLIYLAQTWSILPALHPFSLYLHGPYSRELDGELMALRAAGFVRATPDPSGYGSRYAANPSYVDAARRAIGSPQVLKRLDVVAATLAPLSVRMLEAISTAEYVRQSRRALNQAEQVAAVRELKPHLTVGEVEKAIETLDDLRAEASR